MTIRDLYNFAVQNGITDDELMIKTNDGKIECVIDDMISPSYRSDITVINLCCKESVENNGNGLE